MCLKSCCCCSLKTGTIIIASLGWIFTIIKVFFFVQQAAQNPNGTGGTSTGVNIGYTVVALLTCISLVYGVTKNNQYFLLPWLILSCLEYVATSILSIVFLVLICNAGAQIQTAGVLGYYIFLLFVLVGITGLCWYFWAVVVSYYKQLARGEVGGLHSV